MDERQVVANNRRFAGIVDACRSFVECYLALLRRDKRTRAEIEKLILQSGQDEVDEIERESIYATIAQSLFPDSCEAADDWLSSGSPAPVSHEVAAAAEAMDVEEATFAARLAEAMKAKGVTQSALASQIGVGQPAISMMLSRGCRPQRRTVERLARALGIEPSALWPRFPDLDSLCASDPAPEARVVPPVAEAWPSFQHSEAPSGQTGCLGGSMTTRVQPALVGVPFLASGSTEGIAA